MIYYIWRIHALALYRKMIFFENFLRRGFWVGERQAIRVSGAMRDLAGG